MSINTTIFTEAELAYLAMQRFGRLATVSEDGVPQNNPVGLRYNPVLSTIDIHGYRMGATKKFRNVRANPHVSLVVDDVPSLDPFVARGIEIRGTAEAVDDEEPPMANWSRQVIRIRPRRLISWGVDDGSGMQARVITDDHQEAPAS